MRNRLRDFRKCWRGLRILPLQSEIDFTARFLDYSNKNKNAFFRSVAVGVFILRSLLQTGCLRRLKSDFLSIMDIPHCNRVNKQLANADQLRFYSKWCHLWRHEKILAVDGNLSYLFWYIDLILGQSTAKVINELSRLISAYQHEQEFLPYCQAWLSDCYMVQRDFKKALDVFPSIPINSRSATKTDSLLSIKRLLGLHLSGENVLTLNGPRVTAWGKAHLS